MDFGASTSGFEAGLCHLIFYLFGIECSYLLTFWRPQPTLPCFGLQYSISKKTRTTVSLSLMQGVFAKSSLHKQAWRNPKEDRMGCLHQDIFTRKVTDIAFTSDFCNNYSHPTSPASLYLTSPRPILDVLKSPHTRPDVPVPLLCISQFHLRPAPPPPGLTPGH